MQLLNSDLEQSYISLQPPPGRAVKESIQFESLNLYLWTSADFVLPAILFYAGPIYQEGTDDINEQPPNTDDGASDD